MFMLRDGALPFETYFRLQVRNGSLRELLLLKTRQVSASR